MIDIGNRRELFVDRHLVQKLEGAELRMHAPARREVALRFGSPWEGAFVAYVTVFQDGPLYRMYYRGWPNTADPLSSCICYAESSDGIRWDKPALGLLDFAGSRQNNILLMGEGTHAFSPFLDGRPGAAEDQKYKALALAGGDDKPGQLGLIALASADGLRWRKLQDEPVMTRGGFDSQNLAFWSQTEGCYVAYFRLWSDSPDWRIFRGKRTVGRATSEDFLHWSPPAYMSFGDTPMEELYTNQTTPYFRAPHIYVALPKRFMKGRRSPMTAEEIGQSGIKPDYANDVSEGVFMTSRGGNRYDRTFMEAFFRPGRDPANWVSRNNMAAWGIVQTGSDEMSLYYTQHYAQPSCHLLRASLRLDGFASLSAGYAGGRMLTRPFTFQGGRLEINFASSAAGSVRVELQDADGKPAEGLSLDDCQEIYGDAIERLVTWKPSSDLSAWAGKPVRLCLVLKDADVYSMRFF